MKRGRKPYNLYQLEEFMNIVKPLFDQGWTQIKIAEHLGISQPTVSKRVNRYQWLTENG